MPSSIAGSPPVSRLVASRRPTTAGRPSERARIATCDVRVPASVAIAGDGLAIELHASGSASGRA